MQIVAGSSSSSCDLKGITQLTSNRANIHPIEQLNCETLLSKRSAEKEQNISEKPHIKKEFNGALEEAVNEWMKIEKTTTATKIYK